MGIKNPEMTPAEFGDRCREVRKYLGISQRAMALRLTVHERTYQSWEAGEKLPHNITRQRVLGMKSQKPKDQR